jgi:hypothetical protein
VLTDTDQRLVIRPAYSAGDVAFRAVLRFGGIAVLSITGLIAFFLILRGGGALARVGFHFLTTREWIPSGDRFGIGSLLPNGTIIAAIALFIAIPVAVGAALFISEYAPARLKRPLIALIDLMAAIPSIVYGLWGVFFLQPRVIGTIRWMSEHLGFIPDLRSPWRAHPVLVHHVDVHRRPGCLLDDYSHHRLDLPPGLLAGATVRARGSVRTRCEPVGHDPHGRTALWAWGHDRGDHAGVRTGHGGDHRDRADHLADLRHRVPHL